ncbi:MAG: PASTA domain-containing protein [Candidatus Hydrothermia bacterium]
MKKFSGISKFFVENKFGRLLSITFFTLVFLFILGFISLFIVDKVALSYYVRSKKLVEVPYVTGLPLEEGTIKMKEKHLKWKTVGNGKYIYKTEPVPGILVKEGRIITVYLTDNPRQENF